MIEWLISLDNSECGTKEEGKRPATMLAAQVLVAQVRGRNPKRRETWSCTNELSEWKIPKIIFSTE